VSIENDKRERERSLIYLRILNKKFKFVADSKDNKSLNKKRKQLPKNESKIYFSNEIRINPNFDYNELINLIDESST